VKAILRFDLPEERDEFETAANAWKWRAAVTDIVNELRRLLKYCDAGKEIEDLNTWVWQQLGEDGLDPWGE